MQLHPTRRVEMVLEHMKKLGVPLTRENYLFWAYLGAPPEELGPEEEAELPEEFQLNPPENIE
jgi:hypothetical protein